MDQQSPGQRSLPLWPRLHPCPVCAVDRATLGHYVTELAVTYSVEDLVQHLGSCPGPDRGIYGDEVDWELESEPFDS